MNEKLSFSSENFDNVENDYELSLKFIAIACVCEARLYGIFKCL